MPFGMQRREGSYETVATFIEDSCLLFDKGKRLISKVL